MKYYNLHIGFFKLVFIGLLMVSVNLYPQRQPSTISKKALRFYQEGLGAYRLLDYAEAEYNLKEAINADSHFLEAYMVLAEVYWDQSKYEPSITTYNKAIEIDPAFYPRAFLNKGRLELKVGKYTEARESLSYFLAIEKNNQKDIQKAEKALKNAEYALKALEHPVSFEPLNLGPAINTKDDEYWPSLSADEKTLVFTRLLGSSSNTRNIQEDFFISEFSNNEWSEAENMGKPLNTYGNEGAQTISADGKTMVYTVCNQRGVIGRCDLFIAYKKGDEWTIPRNIGQTVNTTAKETQPSLSADGRELYFASDRPGGKGGLDIWRSTRREDNTWTKPVNLGDSINTPGDEVSPFIHFDNRTLYFSSNYRLGMGEHDIFVSTIDTFGNWSTPRNIGYPINTYRDEFGLIVNAKGDFAYYASDVNVEYGKDIYKFKLYDNARPQQVSYIKGKVFNKETLERIEADFELHDLEHGLLIGKFKSDPKTGEFIVCLPTNRNYLLNVNKNGYLFYSDHFALKGVFDVEKPFLKDVPLSPIKSGESIVLKNVFYDTDSYTLKPESRYELNKLVQFMNNNSALKIQISGHTDNTGTEQYNFELSEKRANSVVRFLIEKGIAAERLKAAGFGMSKPVDTNETEAGRANNRRTELLILE